MISLCPFELGVMGTGSGGQKNLFTAGTVKPFMIGG